MSKLMIALFVTAGLGLAGPGVAQTTSTPMSKDCYTMAKKNASYARFWCMSAGAGVEKAAYLC